MAFDDRLQTTSAEDKDLAREWYTLDTNAQPRVYVLRPLRSKDDKVYWDEVLPKLLSALKGLEFEDGMQVGISVTHMEVLSALRDPEYRSRVFWLRRLFHGGVPASAPKYWDFNDCSSSDPSKKTLFDNMIDHMEQEFPAPRVILYEQASFDSYQAKDAVWTQQIKRWERDVCDLLSASLDQVIVDKKTWDENGCGMGK